MIKILWGWKMKVKLGDIAAIGDVPFVNAGHLNGRSIRIDNMNYISQEKYDSLNSGSINAVL